MKRIDDREVELTDDEMRASDLMRESNADTPYAASEALNRVERTMPFPTFSFEFAAYLSEDTVVRWADRWVVKQEWQSDPVAEAMRRHPAGKAAVSRPAGHTYEDYLSDEPDQHGMPDGLTRDEYLALPERKD